MNDRNRSDAQPDFLKQATDFLTDLQRRGRHVNASDIGPLASLLKRAHDDGAQRSAAATVDSTAALRKLCDNLEERATAAEMRVGDRLFEQFELGRWAGLEEALTALKRINAPNDIQDAIRERLYLHFKTEEQRRAAAQAPTNEKGKER